MSEHTPNMDIMLDDYFKFKRADLNQNGRISVSEALTFFQDYNLPTENANDKLEGFVDREELNNALKLVSDADVKEEEETLSEPHHDSSSSAIVNNNDNIPEPKINSLTLHDADDGDHHLMLTSTRPATTTHNPSRSYDPSYSPPWFNRVTPGPPATYEKLPGYIYYPSYSPGFMKDYLESKSIDTTTYQTSVQLHHPVGEDS